jgi:hypothetical protein
MSKDRKISQILDQASAAQLRVQQYQESILRDAYLNKEFQNKIKNLVFEVRKKAESLMASNNDSTLKTAVGMLSINLFNKLPLSALNFHEITDKEYFHTTITNLESVVNSSSADERAKIENLIEAYNLRQRIEQMEEDYAKFDDGKSKFAKWLYLIFYPIFCVITVIGIPLLFFTKKVVRWAEGSSYKQFKIIATTDLNMRSTTGFLKAFLSKPFTGKYPELKEVKNLWMFREFCIEQKNDANQKISRGCESMPGIKNIIEEFI